jgi:dTDP-4-dehydrorhamnose 3,5-epimerase
MDYDDIGIIKLEKHPTKDIHDQHVNGSLTVIWRDWDIR